MSMAVTEVTRLQTWLDKHADVSSGLLIRSIRHFQSERVVANDQIVQPQERRPYTLH